MELPYSQACENNKDPILEVLKYYQPSGTLLEMGHGTGQHATYIAPELDVQWYAADVEQNLWIMQQLELPKNIHPNIELEVGKAPLSEQLKMNFDHLFTANTLHIMSEANAYGFCEEVAEVVKDYLFIYGPFKYQGEFTSESNRNFDQFLKERNPASGIRDFESLASRLPFKFIKRHDLPANNQLLVFKK